MNQPSTDSSISSRNGASADAISQRAYEIWEREGRPEGCDQRHWLQAEQELKGSNRSDNGRNAESASGNGSNGGARATATDSRSVQTGRATPPPSRDAKRPTSGPFSDQKTATTSAVSGQNAAKRKPTAAPAL